MRNFKPVEPIVVSKVNGGYLFERREELDPQQLRRQGGAKKQYKEEHLLKHLPNEGGLESSEWFKLVEKATGMKEPTFIKLRTNLKKREDVYCSTIENRPLWGKRRRALSARSASPSQMMTVSAQKKPQTLSESYMMMTPSNRGEKGGNTMIRCLYSKDHRIIGKPMAVERAPLSLATTTQVQCFGGLCQTKKGIVLWY